MTALNFPDSPTPGVEFSSGSSVWVWDGSYWNLKGTYGLSGPTGPQGIKGDVGPQGPSGVSAIHPLFVIGGI